MPDEVCSQPLQGQRLYTRRKLPSGTPAPVALDTDPGRVRAGTQAGLTQVEGGGAERERGRLGQAPCAEIRRIRDQFCQGASPLPGVRLQAALQARPQLLRGSVHGQFQPVRRGTAPGLQAGRLQQCFAALCELAECQVQAQGRLGRQSGLQVGIQGGQTARILFQLLSRKAGPQARRIRRALQAAAARQLAPQAGQQGAGVG